MQEFCMVGGYTEDLTNHRTVKIGGWALAQGWVLARDNTLFPGLLIIQVKKERERPLSQSDNILYLGREGKGLVSDTKTR